MRERVTAGVIAVLLAASAFCFGAVYPWAYLPLLAAAVAVGAAGLRLGRGRAFPLSLGVAFVAVGVAIGAQLVPLPGGVLERAVPTTHRLLEDIDAAYAARGGAHALSVHPTSTALALAFYSAFALLVAGLSVVLSRSATAVRLVAGGIVGTGALLASVGLAQRATFNGRVLWVWEPSGWHPPDPFGPFLNRNHFAGWMIMALPVVLGWFAARCAGGMRHRARTTRERLLWLGSPAAGGAMVLLAAAVLMALSLVLTLSRSGIIGLLAVAATFGAVLLTRTGGAARTLAVTGLATMLLVALVQAGTDPVFRRFAGGASSLEARVEIWDVALDRIGRFWPTGTGLNTFGVVTLATEPDRPWQFTEAHNEYLQLASEGGVLVVVPVLVLVGFAFATIRRRFRADRPDGVRRWIRFGAVTGLLAIALQAAVDFSLHVPANALLLSVLLAVALHRAPVRVKRRRPVLIHGAHARTAR